MTGPIHPDTFDHLCQDSRRLKFLAAYVKQYGTACGRLYDPYRSFYGLIDRLMAEYPELTEERTEAQANG